ncbi:mitochondrial S-adenosylmethionine carrier protein-like isoform X1 [Brevipalpus obovatus]
MSEDLRHSFGVSLVSGAFAGMLVDSVLFPLDTLKTRLQSQHGFWKSGGFLRVYRGLGSAMIVSAPNAAAFFSVYETVRLHGANFFGPKTSRNEIFLSMIGASFGEMAACSIRVPVEVIKQRAQSSNTPTKNLIREALQKEGFFGLYRGFFSTISRDIPFALIQLPLWEYLKQKIILYRHRAPSSLEACLCGSVAGFVAAVCTNPIDVAKTRIMLARNDSKYGRVNFFLVIRYVFEESGLRGLYFGATPRILFITLGGAIYLGGYDFSVRYLESLTRENRE